MRLAAYSRNFDEEGEGDNSYAFTWFTCEKVQLLWSLPHTHTLRSFELARNRQNTEKGGIYVGTW